MEGSSMSWKHDYLERANSIACMDTLSIEYMDAWNKLEDDILGKLSIWMCKDLYNFVSEIPTQGAIIIFCMLQETDLVEMSWED